MKVKTKYNVGDKVWFYIEEENQYAWGIIEEISVEVTENRKKIRYGVENRFYDPNRFTPYYPLSMDRITYRDMAQITLSPKKVFDSPEQVIDCLRKEQKKELMQVKELKKGWFR